MVLWRFCNIAFLQRVLEGQEDPPLPASMVKPSNGELYWFMDKDAAQKLKSQL